jgi:hypothetical protein
MRECKEERLGSAADGRITLSHTFVAPAFTKDKKSRCDIKFVKWLVRKNRALSMSKEDACQDDADMGRRENQEHSGCTLYRRDEDFHHC